MPRIPRNVVALGAVSLLTDTSSEMIYPLLPLFLTSVLGASAVAVGAVEGTAESTAALLKLASGWWSDRVRRRKPLVVAGYTVSSVARPLVALAQSATHVLLVRVGDRLGKGVRTSPRDALIADSVAPDARGRAFGFHRASDHAGAVLGPLIAFALLHWAGVSLRTLFWLAAIPGAMSVAVLVLAVREPRGDGSGSARGAERGSAQSDERGRRRDKGRDDRHESRAAHASGAVASAHAPSRGAMGGRFWFFLGLLFVFTLGNSSEAFLLLRARQLGVAEALIPILWAMLHVVKSATSTPAGSISDRIGRRPLIVAGWLLYGLVYLAFARAGVEWQAWALFAAYGVYFGLTEGVEKAMIADLVPAARRGLAFGWYNLAIGVGALPASILFGEVWERASPAAAFTLGAALSGVAAVGVTLMGSARRRVRA
ncbi:MAG TPA: MFS transporter [Gemmatimonadaceae bacterium]|nr:MFS transporter [Gemmatimonadaceae bacterium]